MTSTQLILGSSSPYRRELLERLKIPFQSAKPQFDEENFQAEHLDLAPRELCEALAFQKALSLSGEQSDAWVIGSDQLLNLQGQTFGKAGTQERAIEQLQMLSGKTHELITAVTLGHPSEAPISFTQITRISLRSLSEEEIRRYVQLDNPIDCAGSYKMESLGLALVDSIECDDFTGIIGLPLIQLSKELRQIGFDPLEAP